MNPTIRRLAVCAAAALVLVPAVLSDTAQSSASSKPERERAHKAQVAKKATKRFTGRGSSCKKPLRSTYTESLIHYGDGIKQMPISFENGSPPADFVFGVPVQPRIPQMRPEPPGYYTVILSSVAKVVICSAYVSASDDETKTSVHHRLSVGPHGRAPFIVAVYAHWFFDVTVYGRYKKGRP